MCYAMILIVRSGFEESYTYLISYIMYSYSDLKFSNQEGIEDETCGIMKTTMTNVCGAMFTVSDWTGDFRGRSRVLLA